MNDSGLLQAILASATDYAIVVMDNAGIVTTWNAGAERLTGYCRKYAVGHHESIMFTEGDRMLKVPQSELADALATGRCADHRWYARKDGTQFWGDSVTTPIYAAKHWHAGFLKILRDTTDKKRADEELLLRTRVDGLTGLANRSAFRDRLSEMVAATLRSDRLLILQMIDLDHFKEVNDTLGHHAGDVLLQQVAQRMRTVTRDTDCVARIGGDEFAVLLPNAHSAEVGGSLASKLLEALSTPFRIEGREVRSGASIGVAVCPQDAKDPDQLLKNADLALYRVKRNGRGGFSCFTEHLDSEAHKRNRDLAELRRAVDEHAFWLAYQPKVSTRSGCLIALEALLRCASPALSGYPIEYVITLAREAGLMPQIGAWVLSDACRQIREWQYAQVAHLKVCVNLCTRELTDPGITRHIDTALGHTGLAPDDLEIEITERQILDSKDQGVATLKALRARGVMVAIDDFGTGYSSLSYLRWMPVDSIKLDRTFMPDIPRDVQSCAIVRAVIGLAHSLNLEVIAEGVESVEQLDFLRNEQCEYVQGYFFSRPLDAGAMTAWLNEHCADPSCSTALQSRAGGGPASAR
jgi:diguanylate cyclase (GGDEF)-like protein/PAS domain S-box-containing protein